MQVGHSLLTLRMSNGLSDSTTELPSKPFKSLTNLQHLDLSNNRIKTMPDTSFHFLKRIKRIELQDNEIQEIRKGTFQVKAGRGESKPCSIFYEIFFHRPIFNLGGHSLDSGRDKYGL